MHVGACVSVFSTLDPILESIRGAPFLWRDLCLGFLLQMKVANECTNIHAPSKTLRLQTGVDYHTLTSSQPRLLRQHGSMKEKAYALRPKKMVEQYDALYDDGWQVEFEWTSFKILR